MDFRFSVRSVDLTEKDKSVNEANLTLPQGCAWTLTIHVKTCNVNGNVQYSLLF